jgi:hypothetical protein
VTAEARNALRQWARGAHFRPGWPFAARARSVAAMVAVVAAWAGSCRSAADITPAVYPSPAPVAQASPEPLAVPLPAVTVDAIAPEPRLRVGLTTESRQACVTATHGSVLVHGGGRARTLPRATFVPLASATSVPRFRIQVASLTDESAAQVIATQAAKLSGLTPYVKWNPQSRTFQVRVATCPPASRRSTPWPVSRAAGSREPGWCRSRRCSPVAG